jgi:hypothetical protein
MASEPVLIEKREELSQWLSDPDNEGQVVRTTLAASEQVIARVTDGIYRQPASALRELISNAWDADATSVTILTDSPRFSRIYVRDDGSGMSHQTLARLLKSIGGSAKRREEGKDLGITSSEDSDRTPGGRPIIGKIGIGLFSISQLARRFEIITKIKGSNYRLVAQITLRTYSEASVVDVDADGQDEYLNGQVLIRRESTDDLDAHGTDIILDDVKPRVRDILRSADRWESVAERKAAFDRGDLETWASMRVEAPTYHSGYIGRLVDPNEEAAVLEVAPELPWTTEDPPEVRMAKLMDAVEGEFSRLDRPDLANTLDTYLEILWTLGLSAPVEYVDKHPFDLTSADNVKLFWVTRERGRGQELDLNGEQTVREAVRQQVAGSPQLEDGLDPVGGFAVFVDGVQLKRPIRFKFYQTERRGLESAVIFVGRYEPNLASIAESERGGDLALDGYLFWTGRIVPKENNGVLLRIRGASGASFDPTFLNYQVSEQTRLRQITSELFVRRGLDAALNIDRESFNYAHPHVQLVTLWLHGGIRQLTNRLKDEAQRLREARQQLEAEIGKTALGRTAVAIWRRRQGDIPLPEVVIAATPNEAQVARQAGYVPILRSVVPHAVRSADRTTRDSQAKALVQILSAYDVLEGRSYQEQQELIEAILGIFLGSEA